MNVYEIVTNRIVEKLKQGIIPWSKPWNDNNKPVNWVTQRAYSGVNLWILDSGEYATFKQITDAGGKVRKGAKAEIVVYWQMLKKEDKDGKEQTIPLLKYYNVFNIEKDTDLKPKRQKVVANTETKIVEKAEEIFNKYLDKPLIKHIEGDNAYYQPSTDELVMPKTYQFKGINEYYSVIFHELVHSTGHEKRLNRLTSTRFGSEEYAKEELVAELGASILCGMSDILEYTIDNSVAYIQSWIKKLQDDTKLIISASSQAEKAVKYMLGGQQND